jgi:hypothetical protein
MYKWLKKCRFLAWVNRRLELEIARGDECPGRVAKFDGTPADKIIL